MEIPGKMKIELLHGNNLRHSSSGGSALYPETGSQRRLPEEMTKYR